MITIRHDHDSPSQQISSPDFVNVEVPHAAGVTPSQPPLSISNEVSLLSPQAASDSRPGSTLHSLSTAIMFYSDGGAEPADLPVAASSCKPIPRSVRIVSW
jgi:hypothetical protein